MAAASVGALIAGERSAPRNTLRVITVSFGPFLASATVGSASASSAPAISADIRVFLKFPP